MKDGFKEGNKVSKKFEINLSRTITVAGGEFDVYATPEMVRDIERTCKDYILKFADEGEDSVGTKVEIAHVGATLLNMSVEITAVVQKINGRHIIFEVCVKDDIDIVGTGTHHRFLANATKSADRLRKKAEKVGLQNG